MRRRPPANADDMLVRIVAALLMLFAGLLAYRVLWNQAEANTPAAVESVSAPEPTPEDVAKEIRRIALEAQLRSLREQRQAPPPVKPAPAQSAGISEVARSRGQAEAK